MTWQKLRVIRGNKEALVFLSKGKAKYLRFTPAFMLENKLEKKQYVEVFIDKTDKKMLIGFTFKDDKGMLKIARNDKGAGFISGSTIFKELSANGISKDKADKIGKHGFKAKEEQYEGSKLFVIEIPKE
jgi:hypothetical protein